MTYIFDLFRIKYDCPVCFQKFVMKDDREHDHVDTLINFGEGNQESKSIPICKSCSDQRRRLMDKG